MYNFSRQLSWITLSQCHFLIQSYSTPSGKNLSRHLNMHFYQIQLLIGHTN